MTNPSKELPIAGEVFSVKGCTAFLIPPEQATAGNETPWVWYAPTLPGLPGPEEKWMFQKFLNAGIAVAGIDVGESHGSPAGAGTLFRFLRGTCFETRPLEDALPSREKPRRVDAL